MPRKRLDPSGAILFIETSEEKDARNLKEKVLELEKRINSLEQLIKEGGLKDETTQKMGTN